MTNNYFCFFFKKNLIYVSKGNIVCRNITIPTGSKTCLFFWFLHNGLCDDYYVAFLPLYIEELGVHGHSAVVQWSGIAFSATFISAGLIAPVWGRLGDRFGRKSMLVRASLGMAIAVSLMGMVTNIWQLIGLRLLIGLAGGYSLPFRHLKIVGRGR